MILFFTYQAHSLGSDLREAVLFSLDEIHFSNTQGQQHSRLICRDYGVRWGSHSQSPRGLHPVGQQQILRIGAISSWDVSSDNEVAIEASGTSIAPTYCRTLSYHEGHQRGFYVALASDFMDDAQCLPCIMVEAVHWTSTCRYSWWPATWSFRWRRDHWTEVDITSQMEAWF